MQYYIISYFLKKFTFINTEVEIAAKIRKNKKAKPDALPFVLCLVSVFYIEYYGYCCYDKFRDRISKPYTS